MTHAHFSRKSKGFSVVELIAAIAIVGVLSAVVIASFSSVYEGRSLELDTHAVTVMLEEARTRTIAARDREAHGVYFTATTSTLFAGTYSAGDPDNEVFNVSNGITIGTALSGGGSTIMFDRITGRTSNFGDVVLNQGSSASTTISVQATGLIE